jgi:hypothetical protein
VRSSPRCSSFSTIVAPLRRDSTMRNQTSLGVARVASYALGSLPGRGNDRLVAIEAEVRRFADTIRGPAKANDDLCAAALAVLLHSQMLSVALRYLEMTELQIAPLQSTGSSVRQRVSTTVRTAIRAPRCIEALPDELLVRIFKQVILAKENLSINSSRRMLAHVCRRWRALFHHEGSLHSHINVTELRSPEDARRWCNLVKSAPRTVHIRDSSHAARFYWPTIPSHRTNTIADIAHAVFGKRDTTEYLRVDRQYLAPFLAAAVDEEGVLFRALSCLSIHDSSKNASVEYGDQHILQALLDARRCPNLVELHLSGDSSAEFFSVLVSATNNVTTLRLEFPFNFQVRGMESAIRSISTTFPGLRDLHLCDRGGWCPVLWSRLDNARGSLCLPHLVRLRVDIQTWCPPDTLSLLTTALSAPQLYSLAITGVRWHHPETIDFLENIHAPALQELTYEEGASLADYERIIPDTADNGNSSPMSIISSKWPRLSYLRLDTVTCTCHLLPHLFKLTSLRELVYHTTAMHHTNILLQALATIDAGEMPLPSLQALVLNPPGDPIHALILVVLRSITAAVVPIRSVAFEDFAAPPPSSMAFLRTVGTLTECYIRRTSDCSRRSSTIMRRKDGTEVPCRAKRGCTA